MAQGVSFGIDLKFLDKLKEAEETLQIIALSTEQLEKTTISAFSKMTKSGIVPFLNELKQQKKIYEEIGKVKINSNNSIFNDIQQNAAKAVDDINQVILALEKIKGYRNEASGKTAIDFANKTLGARGDKSIDNLRKAISQLEAAQNRQNLNTKRGQANFEKLGKTIVRVKDELNKLQQVSEKVNVKHQQLIGISERLGPALKAVFSLTAIRNYMSHLINLRGEFELQHRSMQAIIGDTQMANRLWEQTTQLAIRSPYRVKELVTYTKQLAAYRIENEKLYDTTKRLADIASGVGIDMQRLILAYGQVKAANYLRGTELRQFSEAGINILGKLADRFTELEGRAVSVGDVFERVSKRMVSFADVEAVLKGMTDVGGEFYNMQEIQAETLKGLTSNLRDQLDLMINDIGKANENLLKGGVKAAAELVKHYKVLLDIINAIVASMGAMTIASTIQNWGALTFGANRILVALSNGKTFKEASAGLRGIDGIIKKLIARVKNLKGAFSGLLKFFKSPTTLVIGAFAALLALIIRINKRIKETNNVYDELTKKNNNVAGSIAKYNLEIEKNNKIIKENQAIVEDLSKTDEERAIAQEKLTQAQKDNISITNKIQSTYSSLADEFKVAKDGIIDFANAFKIANIELATSASLADKMKRKGFDDALSESYKDYAEEIKAVTTASNAFDLSSTNFLGSVSSNRNVKELQAIAKDIELARQYAAMGDRVKALNVFGYGVKNKYGLAIKDIENIQKAISDYVSVVVQSKSEQDDFVRDISEGRDDIKAVYNSYLTLGLSAEQAQKRLKDYINTWLTEMGVVDERARDIAQETLMLEFDFEIDFSEDVDKEVKAKYKEIAETIISNKKKETPIMEFTYSTTGIEETTEFAEAIDAVVKGYQETDDKIQKLKNSSGKYNEEELTQLNLRLNTLKDIAKEYGILHLLDSQGIKTSYDLNKKRIGLIEDMRRAYVEASRYNTTPDLSSFEDAFNELFVGTDIKFSDILVASSGDVTETLNKLRPLVERIGGKSGKLLMAEFEKTVAKYATESTVDGIESYLKGVKTAMDNLFEDYRAGLELAEMGFTNKNIKDLFGVETVSIETMKSVLGQMENRLKELGTEGTKIFEYYSNKIADLEDKEQQKRLKEYSKYLLKGQSERLKIEKDTLRQIREVNELMASGAYTDTEANDIIKGIQAERNKQIAKLDWQQFKESDIYIQMFEDLGDKSYTVLSMIKERLAKVREEMQKSGEAIDPSDMKELVRAMEQVDDAMNKKSLFKGWGQSGYLKEMAHRQEYEEQYAKAVEDSLNAETKKKEATKKLAEAQERYNNAVKEAEQHKAVVSAKADWETKKISGTKEEQDAAEAIYHATYDTYVTQNQQVKVQKILLDAAEENVEQTDKAAETANKGLEDATTNVTNLQNATKKASENFAEMSEIIQGISSITSSLGSSENLFGSDDTKEYIGAIGGMIGDLASAGTGIARVIANPADIGAWVQIINSLISLIDSIFGLGQTKTDRAIDAQYEKIEKLEKEYQKLEKSISEAYDAQDLRRYNKELQDNIELQKQAAAEAKAAAESGKDNEKNQQAAEEAQAKYDELLEESAEKAKELFSTMTNGVFDDTLSAAEGFVDAWLEAYKEVGDGMGGLSDHLIEEMENVLKRQAALQIVGQYANMWKEMLETSAKDGLDRQEVEDYINEVKEDLPQLSEALEQFFKDFPLTSGNELSGIQKGIQGITADQADVLAAYWNSVRFYMASVDQKFDIPLSRISVLTDDYNTNPMLQELKAISGNTSKILDALNSVIDTNGGRKAIRLK